MFLPNLLMVFQIELGFIEQYFVAINLILEIVFGYLKYIFGAILIIIGVLTLLSLRGKYFLERLRYNQEEDLCHNPLTKPRIAIGIFYIIFATGIIFDWFTYFLIIVLDPLPDRFIFVYFQFIGIQDPFGVNFLSDINQTTITFEKTIYYLGAIGSFVGLLAIVISMWQMAVRDKINEIKTITSLISGLIIGTLTGFTTCLPLSL